MAHCAPSPQILVIHLTINVRTILHVCHLSTDMNVIVLSVERAKIVMKVSNYGQTPKKITSKIAKIYIKLWCRAPSLTCSGQ